MNTVNQLAYRVWRVAVLPEDGAHECTCVLVYFWGWCDSVYVG